MVYHCTKSYWLAKVSYISTYWLVLFRVVNCGFDMRAIRHTSSPSLIARNVTSQIVLPEAVCKNCHCGFDIRPMWSLPVHRIYSAMRLFVVIVVT